MCEGGWSVSRGTSLRWPCECEEDLEWECVCVEEVGGEEGGRTWPWMVMRVVERGEGVRVEVEEVMDEEEAETLETTEETVVRSTSGVEG